MITTMIMIMIMITTITITAESFSRWGTRGPSDGRAAPKGVRGGSIDAGRGPTDVENRLCAIYTLLVERVVVANAQRASCSPARKAASDSTAPSVAPAPRVNASWHGLATRGCHAPRSAGEVAIAPDASPLPTAASVEQRLGAGDPLPDAIRATFERRHGDALGEVEIHHDARADGVARSLGALAFTIGQQIGFRAGAWTPHTSWGQALLHHELIHVLQQRRGASEAPEQLERAANAGTAPPRLARAPRRDRVQLHPDRITRIVIEGTQITIYFDGPDDAPWRGTVRSNFDVGEYAAWWQGGWLRVSPAPTDARAQLDISGPDLARIRRLSRQATRERPIEVIVRATAPSTEEEGERAGTTAAGEGPETPAEPTPPAPGAPPSEAAAGSLPVEAEPAAAGVPVVRVSSREQIERLLALGVVEATQADQIRGRLERGEPLSFDEAVALLTALVEYVATEEGTTPAEGAATWLELANFVRENREMLSGRAGTSAEGLTLDEVRQIMDEYGRYVGVEDAPPGEEGEEEERRYDPTAAEAWNRLSAEERQLWRDYISRHGSGWMSGEGGSVELTPDQLFRMAVAISWQYVPGGAGAALHELLEDPLFWIGIFAGIALYLVMWIVPEPIISKATAITITLALLAVFSASEIYNLAVAWRNLSAASERITNIEQLEAAAEGFGAAMGGTGARVLVMLALILAGGRLPTPRPMVGGPPSGPSGMAPALAGTGTQAMPAATAIQVLADGTVVVVAAPAGVGVTAMATGAGGGGGGGGAGEPPERGGARPSEPPDPAPASTAEPTTEPPAPSRPGRAAAPSTTPAAGTRAASASTIASRLGINMANLEVAPGSSTGRVFRMRGSSAPAREVAVADLAAADVGDDVILALRDQPAVDGFFRSSGRPIQLKRLSGAPQQQPNKVVTRANDAFRSARAHGFSGVDVHIHAPGTTTSEVLARWVATNRIPPPDPGMEILLFRVRVHCSDGTVNMPLGGGGAGGTP